MAFKKFNFHPAIQQAIEEIGHTKPTPIQDSAIPEIQNKRDLIASAQTGTGKTAAFTLPALQRLTLTAARKGPQSGPRILVLVPTRELAMQVAIEFQKYGKHMLKGAETVCLFGGAPYPAQNKQLSRPYEILVATPGRLMDHMQRGRINFSQLEIFILDEADRMLDMGFIESVDYIANAIPKTIQTLMFSATIKGNVLKLSKRLLNDPKEIDLTSAKENHDHIQQFVCHVRHLNHKLEILDTLLKDPTLKQAVVFTSTKLYADELVDELRSRGQYAAALHGDLPQRKRTQTIEQMRQGKIKILVATDVAARGIDVPTISHVINFDLPMHVEDYVHRIGRTGRAEATGIALSFVGKKDLNLVSKIEQYMGRKIPTFEVPGGSNFQHAASDFSADRGGGRRPPFGGAAKPRFKPRAPSQPPFSREGRGESRGRSDHRGRPEGRSQESRGYESRGQESRSQSERY